MSEKKPLRPVHLVWTGLASAGIGILLGIFGYQYSQRHGFIHLPTFNRLASTPTTEINNFRVTMRGLALLGDPPYITGASSCRAYFIAQQHFNSCIYENSGNNGVVIEMGYVPPSGGTPARLIPYLRPAKYDDVSGKITVVPNVYYKYDTDIGCPNDCADYYNLTP